MCTVINMNGKNHYFGRTLDLSYHYKESVTITPRKFLIRFSDGQKTDSHYAMIGIATVFDNYPLYYDATNECGLSIAALNFPGNAAYNHSKPDKTNVASYELIPWLLSQYSSVGAVKQALGGINITDKAFRTDLQPTALHWMISDKNATIVLEPTAKGIKIYDNPVNVLTNNPPFPYHLYNLENYLNITAQHPNNRFSNKLNLQPHSVGMGAIGLPGDSSSQSRFVRAAFHLHNAIYDDTEDGAINCFFHILRSVAQAKGCVEDNGSYTKTVYSSCCNMDKGIFYYTTYENMQITAVSMYNENIDSEQLVSYPLQTKQVYRYEN